MRGIRMLAAVALLAACGGGGSGGGDNSPGAGEGSGGIGNVTASGGSGGSGEVHNVRCDFGNDNSFVFEIGDNSTATICTEEGGTISNIPDNSNNPVETDNSVHNPPMDAPTPASVTKALGFSN